MAKLCCINNTSKQEWNNLGDIVAIFEDSVQPTPAELINFDFFYMEGSASEVQNNLMDTYMPELAICWKNGELWDKVDVEPCYTLKYVDGVVSHNYI